MAAPRSNRNRKLSLLGWVTGAALAVLAGQILLQPAGDGLARLSYDLPFPLGRARPPEELVMVYLDSSIKARLKQPTDQPLARHFYDELLTRLHQGGARLVLFDILFDNPDPQPAVDAAFAETIRRHGRVVLVGYRVNQFQGNVVTTVSIPPTSVLAEACAAWGLAEISQDPADNAVRKLDPGIEDLPSAGWAAAKVLDAEVTRQAQARLEKRWLNYYCEPVNLKAVNLDHILQADGLPEDFFRGKIVVVGGRPAPGIAGAEREEFGSPFTRFDGSMASGPSIHAFTLLNLLRGDWLRRAGPGAESALVLVWGFLISAVLISLRPLPAFIAALASFVILGLLATYVQLRHQVWFSWLVPSAAQTSVALVWSIGFKYLVELRRRKHYRRAFAAYCSPYMADRIAESDFDLTPGGKEVEATIMFTDLEGFTPLSETLLPSEVSKLLIAYFEATTQAILAREGFIIKFVGDSVMAVWGAPLGDEQRDDRAVLAAIAMRKSGQQEFEGRRLRTRIGINSGKVLAGNLGSKARFDYTCIGPETNFASRLEGLNKYLGTDILISESTRRGLKAAVQLRALGRFIVAGTTRAHAVYEVLGEALEFQPPPAWLDVFARGLESYAKGDLGEAGQRMRKVIEMRGGKDGPAEFYLKQIAKDQARPKDGAWDGTVILESK